MENPVVLVHGYSDKGTSFREWESRLVARGFPKDKLHVVTYESLTDEVTIKDIAEGFDRALRLRAGFDEGQEFDAIVHSTGMLVIRSWLAHFPRRKARLKRLVGLAPATFGSPLAHTGRSTLGAIFKGRKQLGADFLEAGKEVLDSLELGSRFTWELAHRDMIGQEPTFGPDRDTPYAFVFCGDTPYSGLRRLVNRPGTDGTVRWAGCGLNSRKITVDLTRPADAGPSSPRISVAPWSNVELPVYMVEGANHGGILSEPSDELVERVHAALSVGSREDFAAWSTSTEAVFPRADRGYACPFQQFVVHAVDERGDGIDDYDVRLLTRRGDAKRLNEDDIFDLDVHVYERDPSFRCFHVDLQALSPETLAELRIRITASSGSRLVGYLGYGTQGVQSKPRASLQTIEVDITASLSGNDFKFFYSGTTTLIEVRLNREPLPQDKANEVCWFL